MVKSSSSEKEDAEQPSMKKPKTTVSQLENDLWSAKRDIQSKYDEKIKLLKTQMAQEIAELTHQHNAAVQDIREYEAREKAGTLEANMVCSTCGKAISEEEEENDEEMEKYFICEECGSHHCNDHIGDTTKCTSCGCHYCESCFDTIDKCLGCMKCPQLTCCTLRKMPCGEYECTESDCWYYHHKHCGCEN